MKRFVVAVLALMLIFTEVLSPGQVNAAESDNQCEEKAFTVDPFIVGDEKLEGEGHPGEEIDLQFKDMEAVIEVDEEGRFEIIWEEEVPAEGDAIMLTNMPYEIELVVEAEITEHEELEAEMVDTCEPEVPSEEVEGTEAEDPVEEEATEEASGKPGEADEIDTPEEPVEEPSPEEESEEVDPKEKSEETPEAESYEEADLTEEPVVEESDEAVPEEDGTPEEAVSSEEPIEEKEKEIESEEAAPNEEDPKVQEKEEVKPEGDADKETDIPKEEVADKHERTEEVESSEKSEEAAPNEEDPEVEEEEEVKSEGDADKETDIPKEEVADKHERMEESESSEEVSSEESIEETEEVSKEESVESGNRMARSSMATVQADSVERQAPIAQVKGSTIRVSTARQFNSALSAKGVELIILEKSIQATSPPTVQSSSGQKIIDANGHSIDLGSSTLELSNGSWFSTNITQMVVKNAKLYTTNTNNDAGFFKKESSPMDLILENIEFNNDNSSEGMLGSSGESDIHFYGHNVIKTGSNYGISFRKVIVHEGAYLTFNHVGSGAALNFKKSAGVNGYGIETRENSYVQFEGESNQLISLDTPITFNIESPQFLDLNNKNSNGQIFSFGDFFTNSPKVEFVVSGGDQKVELSGWLKGDTSKETNNKTPPINIARFNFDSLWGLGIIGSKTKVDYMDPEIPDFDTTFPPKMRRMVFEKPIKEKLEFGAPPKDMAFETTEIKNMEKVIRRVPEEYDIEVMDTRKKGYWKLTAEVISPLSNKNGDTLPKAFYYFKDGYEPKMIEEKVAFKVASKNMDDNRSTQKVSWGRDEGILLKLNPIHAAADTEYKATIEWTLSDGP